MRLGDHFTRWQKRVRKDLKANGASTTAQIAGRIKMEEARIKRELWFMVPGGYVTASGAIDNPATTFTWGGN